MKKEVKAIIAVVLAVWFFVMGFELGAYKERKAQSEINTVNPVTTTPTQPTEPTLPQVTEPSTNPQPDVTEPTLPDDDNTTDMLQLSLQQKILSLSQSRK